MVYQRVVVKTGILTMNNPEKQQPKKPLSKGDVDTKPKRRRGRPEKPLKIDDTPENVARSFFGIKSTKYLRPE